MNRCFLLQWLVSVQKNSFTKCRKIKIICKAKRSYWGWEEGQKIQTGGMRMGMGAT